MKPVSVGRLRHRVELQVKVRADDGAGGAAVSWSNGATLWAAIVPHTGSERLDADAPAGRVTHDVWIRHRPGVTPSMRFALGVRRFEIRAVVDAGGRRRYLKCLCEERRL